MRLQLSAFDTTSSEGLALTHPVWPSRPPRRLCSTASIVVASPIRCSTARGRRQQRQRPMKHPAKILCATRKPHQPFSAMAPRPPRHWRHSLVSYPRFATIRLWPFACNQSHPSHMLRVGYWSLDTSIVLLSCILKMLGLLFEILGLEMVPFSVHFGSLGHPWAR